MAKECKADRTHCFGSHAAALRCVVPACADWHSRPCVAVLTMRDVHGFSWPAASCIAAIATIAITLGTNGYHESSGPQICSSDWQTIGEPLANKLRRIRGESGHAASRQHPCRTKKKASWRPFISQSWASRK